MTATETVIHFPSSIIVDDLKYNLIRFCPWNGFHLNNNKMIFPHSYYLN